MNADDPKAAWPLLFINRLRGSRRARRLLLWGLALTIVLLTILLALPIVTAYYAEQWLVENGAESAQIDDIDINLFTGVVRVSGLRATNGERERLQVGLAEVGIRWWPLASQHVHVEFLRIADGQIDVAAGESGRWQIGGITLEPEVASDPGQDTVGVSADSTSEWGFGSEIVALTDLQLTYRDTLLDTTIDVREFVLGSQFTWEAGRSTSLKVDLDVDGSPLLLNSEIQPWADQRQFSGAFKISDLKLSDYQQALTELAGLGDPQGTINFDLQLNAAYDADGKLTLKVSGPLEINNASFAVADTALNNKHLRWQGQVDLRLPAPEAGPLVLIDGDLQLAGTEVALTELELTSALKTLEWQGVVEFSPARADDESAKLMLTAELAGSGFELHHTRLTPAVASLESLDVSGIVLTSVEQIAANNIKLQGLRVIGRPADQQVNKQTGADVVRLAQLEVAELGFDAQQGLTAQTITLGAPSLTLVRDEQGNFPEIDAAIAAFMQEDKQDDTRTPELAEVEAGSQEASSPALRVVVSNLILLADDLLYFEDRSVTPATRIKLTRADIKLDKLDTAGTEPATINLAVGDGSMQLQASGTINPFIENQTAALTLNLAALDLSQISAYVPGYNIERGRLSADSQVKIEGDTLNVDNTLLIERLRLSGKAAEGNAPIAQGMAMPIDVALDLLRDGDDRIKLQLPVTGSLNDPQIGLGDVIRQATQKALQNAAMSYVKNALQPLGTLLLVRDLAAKAARPRFEPVTMAPGDAALSSKGRDYLSKLSSLLTDRPGLQLTICGVATAADRAALEEVALAQTTEQEPLDSNSDSVITNGAEGETTAELVSDIQLLTLAEQRTAAVIDFLNREEGVARKRLFTCRETIEPSDDDPPRTEISL